jgi:rhodanese-related sulfurtransferase
VIRRTILRAVVIALAALAAGFFHSRLHAPLDLSFAIHPAPPAPAPQPVQPTLVGQAPKPAPVPVPVPAHEQGMIDLARFKSMLASPPLQVLDAREPGEYNKGHITGALSLPMSAFLSGGTPELVNALSRDLPIVVYCGGGDCDASRYVAQRLREMGFATTFVYEDGYTGWTKAGEPVEVFK